MSDKHFIACDLGAESGRVVLGTLSNRRLNLEEVHRFSNMPVEMCQSLRWNLLEIFHELKVGLRKVGAKGVPVSGLSVDSWGVDYVLFNERQPMLSVPYHYRDARTQHTYVDAMERVGRETIFAETGIQFMPINMLYQLIAEAKENPELLACADQFLNIADYLNYLFCGVAKAEVSLASTTQIYNPTSQAWSTSLIERFGFPVEIFPSTVSSGTRLGTLKSEICNETGLVDVEVIASCSHDTGAAVAAIPAEGDGWAYLSSGTWSLIGVELPTPVISHQALEHNFTNELGFGNTSRFLKNISGLWLLQELRRAWARNGLEINYAELSRLAEAVEPFRSLINPNDTRLLSPNDMPTKIANICRETEQPVPTSPGQFVRCVFESLALLYRHYLDILEELTGRKIATLHVVGGGSQSKLLNQFTADATGRAVMAGPVEATAIGNVLIQAIAIGELESLAELRTVVRNSFVIDRYESHANDQWQQAAERCKNLELNR